MTAHTVSKSNSGHKKDRSSSIADNLSYDEQISKFQNSCTICFTVSNYQYIMSRPSKNPSNDDEVYNAQTILLYYP